MPRVADAAHQLPDRAARLRIEAGRQLVEEHDLGIVDERERDEEPLLLAARQRHEPGVALVGEPELLEQPSPSATGLSIERGPEIDRLPHLDALLELRLLQLHADALLQRVDVANRIERRAREIVPRSGRRSPSTHSIVVVLPAPFGPIRPKISPSLDVERHVVDGDEPAVAFLDAGDPDDGHGGQGYGDRVSRLLLSEQSEWVSAHRLTGGPPGGQHGRERD